jgi:PAS domain S-box-containing protein
MIIDTLIHLALRVDSAGSGCNGFGMKPKRAKQNDFTRALAIAFAASSDAVTVADHEGHIIEANEAVERVYRWTQEQIIGKHPLKFCPDTPEWTVLSKEIWNCIHKHGAWDGVVINMDEDKRHFSILLRIRSVVYQGVTYVISWAKPFPDSAPFGLSEQQARVFTLLGQGYSVPDIAVQLANMDRRRPGLKSAKGVSNSTVNEHLQRIWKAALKSRDSASAPTTRHAKVKQVPESETKTERRVPISKLRLLATRCLEMGWDSRMKINSQILAQLDKHQETRPGKAMTATR